MPIVLIAQKSQDNVVRVVNELRPGNRGVIVRISAGSTIFFFSKLFWPALMQSALYSLGNCGYFPGLKAAVEKI